jgi:RNA 2',3'-cyclic 3'-phosphodiesterase
MRLFIGVEIEPAVKTAAGAASELLRADLARTGLDARWVPPENLHVTLWFIGEVTDDKADAIRNVLAVPFQVPRFQLTFDKFGAFPPSGPARVLWIGIRDGAASMIRIYDELRERLLPLRFQAESRAYSPHLTIARVKDLPRSAVKTVRQALGDRRVTLYSSAVDSVTLFRSRLSPRGASYEPLLRVPLA